MKITLSDLNTGKCTLVHQKAGKGYTSTILVLLAHKWRSDIAHSWDVINANYYNTHMSDYVGWIELENVN